MREGLLRQNRGLAVATGIGRELGEQRLACLRPRRGLRHAWKPVRLVEATRVLDVAAAQLRRGGLWQGDVRGAEGREHGRS